MKKLIFLSISAFLLSTVLTSCASKKATKQAVGDVEIKMPCADFRSDKNYFRATQNYESPDLSSSKENALMQAKSRLSGLIQTQMKSVAERYAADRKIDGKSEFNEKVERTTREIITQALYDIAAPCDITLQKSNGNYNTFVTVECSKETIYNGVDKSLSKDAKLRQDYDQQKFRGVFDEEMEKLEKEQNK
jgi:hypothetical protein